MPGLPFAHYCSFSTVITFLRFASQIFFCYREKVIHFLTIELYLYNHYYDLVFKVKFLARTSPGTVVFRRDKTVSQHTSVNKIFLNSFTLFSSKHSIFSSTRSLFSFRTFSQKKINSPFFEKCNDVDIL